MMNLCLVSAKNALQICFNQSREPHPSHLVNGSHMSWLDELPLTQSTMWLCHYGERAPPTVQNGAWVSAADSGIRALTDFPVSGSCVLVKHNEACRRTPGRVWDAWLSQTGWTCATDPNNTSSLNCNHIYMYIHVLYTIYVCIYIYAYIYIHTYMYICNPMYIHISRYVSHWESLWVNVLGVVFSWHFCQKKVIQTCMSWASLISRLPVWQALAASLACPTCAAGGIALCASTRPLALAVKAEERPEAALVGEFSS